MQKSKTFKSALVDMEEWERAELRHQYDLVERIGETKTDRVGVNTASLVGLSAVTTGFGLGILSNDGQTANTAIASLTSAAGIVVFWVAFVIYRREAAVVKAWRKVRRQLAAELGYLAESRFEKELRGLSWLTKRRALLIVGCLYTALVAIALESHWDWIPQI